MSSTQLDMQVFRRKVWAGSMNLEAVNLYYNREI